MEGPAFPRRRCVGSGEPQWTGSEMWAEAKAWVLHRLREEAGFCLEGHDEPLGVHKTGQEIVAVVQAGGKGGPPRVGGRGGREVKVGLGGRPNRNC